MSASNSKELAEKGRRSAKALLAYRSTPSKVEEVRLSYFLVARSDPASFYTGSLKPNWPGIESCKQEESERKIKQKHHYDSRHGVKELEPLQPGDRV